MIPLLEMPGSMMTGCKNCGARWDASVIGFAHECAPLAERLQCRNRHESLQVVGQLQHELAEAKEDAANLREMQNDCVRADEGSMCQLRRELEAARAARARADVEAANIEQERDSARNALDWALRHGAIAIDRGGFSYRNLGGRICVLPPFPPLIPELEASLRRVCGETRETAWSAPPLTREP